MRVDRIWEFLQRLSPLTRSCLLTELERLEMCGVDMPDTADLQARLRAELRMDGPNETPTSSKYLFAPRFPAEEPRRRRARYPGRLRDIRAGIVTDVEVEVSRFPGKIGPILQMPNGRRNGRYARPVPYG